MRSCSDVHNFLSEEDIPHEIIHLTRHCRTAARAAELLGVCSAEVVKSLLFLADGTPTMVIVPGDSTVDAGILREVLGSRRVTLAKGAQVLETTGYRPGAVPPCALKTQMALIADPRVFDPPVVYCGGGTTTTMLKIRSADLKTLVRPRLEPVGAKA